MPKVRYVGPADEVEIAHGGQSWGPVKHGDTIEVPDGPVYEGLVVQESNWEPVTDGRKAATKKDEVES